MAKRTPKYVIIDGCPCPYEFAPYFRLVLRRAGQTAQSIYRGDDAAHLLHAHGKRTQREIHADPALAAISNPAGRSQHELRSDGVGNPGPVGRKLEDWQVGVDSGTNDQAAKDRITAAAHHYGLSVRHPYSRGVEGHHWCFDRKPHADGVHLTKTRVRLTRLQLRLGR